MQGRKQDAALALVDDAKALEAAGCFSIVIEGVPDEVGRMITDAVDVPTIGIGAGAGCDGQVLVFHDVLGLEDRVTPKFVRRYAELANDAVRGLSKFADDVRTGAFPSESESYSATRPTPGSMRGLYGSASSVD